MVKSLLCGDANMKENNKKEKNTRKKVLISIIAVFGAICICTSGYLIGKEMGIFKTGKTYDEVRESYAPNLTIGTTVDPSINNEEDNNNLRSSYAPNLTVPSDSVSVTAPPVDNEVDFNGLRAENSDVYAWIYIPDTNVSLPVLQSNEDDNFYLDHDVYKNYSFPGAIYSQSLNKRDFSDRVTVLYGHNMLNGSMFADLHKFADSDFFESHKYIYIYTPDRRLTYEVVSAYEYDDRHILNSYDFTKDSVFSGWLSSIKSPHSLYSNVRNEVELNLNSKLLVLSTCLNSGDGRFLVQGVLISDEKTK